MDLSHEAPFIDFIAKLAAYLKEPPNQSVCGFEKLIHNSEGYM